MCEDCQRRLTTNIWRMLDCKNPACQEIAAGAPDLVSLMSDDTQAFFARVCQSLDSLGVDYEVAPRLVRGLDYYIHTVFEITHSGLGAQDALAGGGRYRIVLPGAKKPVEGIGFAAGMERLLLARASLGRQTPATAAADIAIISLGENAILPGLRLAQDLRATLSGLRVKPTSPASRSADARRQPLRRALARSAATRVGRERRPLPRYDDFRRKPSCRRPDGTDQRTPPKSVCLSPIAPQPLKEQPCLIRARIIAMN